jgi:small subunit ribosomal protein S6
MAVPVRYRKYETIFITHPDTTDEGHDALWKKVDGVLSQGGGKEIRREFWGRRRLAYEISKQRKGVYHYLMYLGRDELVAELERNFRITDSVVRFMTVRLEDGIDLAHFDIEAEAQKMTNLGRRASQNDDSEITVRLPGDLVGDGDGDDDDDMDGDE